jgi:hypothetical protein
VEDRTTSRDVLDVSRFMRTGLLSLTGQSECVKERVSLYYRERAVFIPTVKRFEVPSTATKKNNVFW